MAQPNNAEAEVEQIMLRIRAELGKPVPDQPASHKLAATSSIVKRAVEALSTTTSLQLRETVPLPKPIQLELSEYHGIVSQSTFQPTADRSYRLKDLFEYQDRDFIHAAYWSVLKRKADDGGFNNYLRLLRGGTSRTEILTALRDSPEGRSAKVTVAGLSTRARMLKISRWPIFGYFGRIVAALWILPEEQRRQREI